MPSRWTTDNQRTFLLSTKSRFLKNQEAKTLDVFWDSLYSEWEARWPIPRPTPLEVEAAGSSPRPDSGATNDEWHKNAATLATERKIQFQRQRIYVWIWNHFSKTQGLNNRLNPIVFQPPCKQTRISIQQAYSRLYYVSKLRAVIDADWTSHMPTQIARGLTRTELNSQGLLHRNRLTQSIYANKGDDVKSRVQEFQKSENKQIEKSNAAAIANFKSHGEVKFEFGSTSVQNSQSLVDDPNAAVELEKTRIAELKERQSKISSLPHVVQNTLKQIMRQTGWGGLMVLFGPNPERGGRLSSFIFSTGTASENGRELTLLNYFLKMEDDLKSKVTLFGSVLYPADVMAASAFPDHAVDGSPADERSNYDWKKVQRPGPAAKASIPNPLPTIGQTALELDNSQVATLYHLDQKPQYNVSCQGLLAQPTYRQAPSANHGLVNLTRLASQSITSPNSSGSAAGSTINPIAPVTDEEIRQRVDLTLFPPWDRERQKNIMRNRIIMERLGLGGHPTIPPAVAPRKRSRPTSPSADDAFQGCHKSSLPQRQSSRIRSINSEGATTSAMSDSDDSKEANSGHCSQDNQEDLVTFPTSPSLPSTPSSFEGCRNRSISQTSISSCTSARSGSAPPPSLYSVSPNSHHDWEMVDTGSHPTTESNMQPAESHSSPVGMVEDKEEDKEEEEDDDGSFPPQEMFLPQDLIDTLNADEPNPALRIGAKDMSLHDDVFATYYHPEWFPEAYQYLEGLGEGHTWMDLVCTYADFEEALGWPEDDDSNIISTEHRPSNVASWLRIGTWTKAQKIAKPTSYGDVWRSWWCSLQPAFCLRCRHANSSSAWPLKQKPVPKTVDWSKLRKGNLRGIYLVLISLGWWNRAATTEVEIGEVNNAIDDVLWVFKTCLS